MGRIFGISCKSLVSICLVTTLTNLKLPEGRCQTSKLRIPNLCFFFFFQNHGYFRPPISRNISGCDSRNWYSFRCEKFILSDHQTEIKTIQSKIEALQQKRDEELGGRLVELEADLSGKEKNAVKLEASLKATRDELKQEERKKKQIEKGMTSVRFLS